MAQTFTLFPRLPFELQAMIWKASIDSDSCVYPFRLEANTRDANAPLGFYSDIPTYYVDNVKEFDERQLRSIRETNHPVALDVIRLLYKSRTLWGFSFKARVPISVSPSTGRRKFGIITCMRAANNFTDLIVLQSPTMEIWLKMDDRSRVNRSAVQCVANLAMPYSLKDDAWDHFCLCPDQKHNQFNNHHNLNKRWCHAPVKGLLGRFTGLKNFYFIIEVNCQSFVKDNMLDLVTMGLSKRRCAQRLTKLGLDTVERKRKFVRQTPHVDNVLDFMDAFARKAKKSTHLRIFEENHRRELIQIHHQNVIKYIKDGDKLCQVISALKRASWKPTRYVDPSTAEEREIPRQAPEIRVLVTLKSGPCQVKWRQRRNEELRVQEEKRERRRKEREEMQRQKEERERDWAWIERVSDTIQIEE